MKPAGVYVHIPFCRSRCSYCDFATGMYESTAAARYVRALTKEISNWTEVQPAAKVDTIYLGGGTPSLLATDQIEQILHAVKDRFQVATGSEVTIEMNPGDGQEKLKEWRGLGINRVSFGAQTFDDDQLRQLGRTHSAEDVRRTFRELRAAGFDNLNFDLIAGLPGQSLAGWERNLDEALALRPEHLSLYLLDVHQGTPLADQIQRGMRPQVDEDLAAEMYQSMIERVCSAGYEHYEISNFCLPGHEARHNCKYWTGEPYYGFGCSAHSYDAARCRWANERDTARYTELIEHSQSVIVERIELSAQEARAESVFLGLRMMRGIDRADHRNRFGFDLGEDHASDIERLRAAGLLEISDQLIRLTARGALLSNEVFATLA